MGNNFYKTQNIGSNPVCVYGLKIIESTFNSITQNVVLAFTDTGIWYTIDDGDHCYRTGTDTDDSLSPITFSSIATLDERFIPQTLQAYSVGLHVVLCLLRALLE